MSFYLQVVKKENIIMSRSLDSPETSRKIEDSRYDSADVSWAHLVWDDDSIALEVLSINQIDWNQVDNLRTSQTFR